MYVLANNNDDKIVIIIIIITSIIKNYHKLNYDDTLYNSW